MDSDKDRAKVYLRRAEALLGCRAGPQRTLPGQQLARGGLAPWSKNRLTAHIEANLARIVRLSAGHFFRALHASFGESPLAYVARRRIRRSQELMLSSGASLAQIAQDCGMSDQPHFTRVFRKLVGLNPSAWRREFTDGSISVPR